MNGDPPDVLRAIIAAAAQVQLQPRPRAQVAPPATRMVAFLKLEAIGDNLRMPADRALHMALRPGINAQIRQHLLLPNRRPWCARLVRTAGRGGWDREFLRGRRDYTEANSKGSRGIYLYFNLYEGDVYEVHEIVSWQRDRRYFVKAVAGAIVEIDKAEVDERMGRECLLANQ